MGAAIGVKMLGRNATPDFMCRRAGDGRKASGGRSAERKSVDSQKTRCQNFRYKGRRPFLSGADRPVPFPLSDYDSNQSTQHIKQHLSKEAGPRDPDIRADIAQ